MGIVVSVLGYAKTGKTLVSEALISGARRRGLGAIYLKCGRLHSSHREDELAHGTGIPDTLRAAQAGAVHCLLWTPEGLRLDEREHPEMPGLPPRSMPAPDWDRVWQETLARALGTDWRELAGLLVVEGRPVSHATVIQITRGDEAKYPAAMCTHQLRGPLVPARDEARLDPGRAAGLDAGGSGSADSTDRGTGSTGTASSGELARLVDRILGAETSGGTL